MSKSYHIFPETAAEWSRILAFDMKTSILLLTSSGQPPQPTILVDTSIPLLGNTPSLKTLDVHDKDSWFKSDEEKVKGRKYGSGEKFVNRETLKLDRGEWVCVVGWFEGDGAKYARKVCEEGSYTSTVYRPEQEEMDMRSWL
jgi:hypothetical protein